MDLLLPQKELKAVLADVQVLVQNLNAAVTDLRTVIADAKVASGALRTAIDKVTREDFRP